MELRKSGVLVKIKVEITHRGAWRGNQDKVAHNQKRCVIGVGDVTGMNGTEVGMTSHPYDLALVIKCIHKLPEKDTGLQQSSAALSTEVAHRMIQPTL